MSWFRAPRLLPSTIAVLAIVLVAKSGFLLRSVLDSGAPAAVFAAAWGAGAPTGASDAPAISSAAPAAAKAKPTGKPPGEFGQQIKPRSGDEPPPNAADVAPVPDATPPMTDAEKAVLLELRDRRRELDTREAALADRESMLAAAEQKLSARIAELQGLQHQLETLDTAHKQQQNAAWQGLVKVYEDMKPRDAAVIFNDLGMPVLLAVVDRMKEAKAAAILAAMAPDKARDVTMQLAALRTKPAIGVDTPGKPVPPPAPAKPPGSGT